MNKKEWLLWRRSGIGASDAPIILGLSPWSSPYELWKKKVEGTETPMNAAMQRGHDLEDTARQEFERIMKVSVFPKFCEHPTEKWMRASLDGIDLEEKICVEIKCGSKKNHEMAQDGKVPVHYEAQIQHQMGVTGLPFIYYFSFDGIEGALVKVLRNEEFICDMMRREKVFWDSIQEGEPNFLDPSYKKGLDFYI